MAPGGEHPEDIGAGHLSRTGRAQHRPQIQRSSSQPHSLLDSKSQLLVRRLSGLCMMASPQLEYQTDSAQSHQVRGIRHLITVIDVLTS